MSLFISSLLFSTLAQAESELWLETSTRYHPIKPLKLELSQLIRFDENISQHKSTMPQLEVKYTPISWAQLAVAYRYLSERSKSGDFEPAHRVHLQAKLKHDLGPIELSYRLRYQEEHEPDELNFDAAFRNRFGLKLDTKTRYKPLLTTELFTDPMGNTLTNTQYRISTGCNIKITKKHRLTVKGIYKSELDGDLDQAQILELSYQYRVPNKKSQNKG